MDSFIKICQHTDIGYKQTKTRDMLPEDPAHFCAHQGAQITYNTLHIC